MKTKYYVIALTVALFFFMSAVVMGQQTANSFPADTSFTLYNALVKNKKNFPQIEPVYYEPNSHIKATFDQVYAKHGNRELHFDLFAPLNQSKPLPVVILIHGGGWISGNKKLTWPMAAKLASEGFVCASVEYRMLLESTYPTAITDIKTAIKHIKANAINLMADTSFVAIYGCSAGGQLAALVATTGNHAAFAQGVPYPNVSDQVQALVDLDGVLHFLHPLSSETSSNPEKPTLATRWLGAHHTEDINRWNEASALSHVDRNTPPTLFIGSQYPRFLAGSEDMIAKLDSMGIYHELHHVENSPHPFWLFEPWFTPVSELVANFLKKTSKAK